MHQTTIVEENETLRGSMDRYPGSKSGAGGTHSGVKKFNRVAQIEKKGSANYSGSGARKAPASMRQGKNAVRTKSSVPAQNNNGPSIGEQASSTSNSLHPLVKGRAANAKVSVSSSNLEESIGGIVGNKITQNKQAGSQK